VTRPFAWRLLNVEYTHSWMNDIGPIKPQEGLKISTQAVVRIEFGHWAAPNGTINAVAIGAIAVLPRIPSIQVLNGNWRATRVIPRC
jgi:hypothetical protein